MEHIAEIRSEDPARPLAKLLAMPLGIDVWEVKSDRLVVRAAEHTMDRLRKMGYRINPIVDVSRHLEIFAAADSMAGYHSVATLEADMRDLAARHPNLAELKEIGRSIEGRPILALRLGERRGNATKVLFMGCHHAREWIAVEVPFLLARELLEKSNDQKIASWLSSGEIWIAPMVNPDGHEFCRTQNRLWRKNRRRNPDGSFGVDPNRNYGYMWGVLDVPTSSHVPSDETYVGPRAFSEPETRAVRDLVARENFAGLITYHSFSQLVLYPWGYTSDNIADPVDFHVMNAIAQQMCNSILGVHGKVYTPQKSSQLYPTAGDTTDWTYGTYGIPSFTVELRPTTVQEGGFILPANQIGPTFEENRAAAFNLIEGLISAPSAARSAAERAVMAGRDRLSAASFATGGSPGLETRPATEIIIDGAVIRVPQGADAHTIAETVRAVRAAKH
jgi:carboxypeptidase T